MELPLLAEHLQTGCDICKKPLSLANCFRENRSGLASTLSIRCECGFVTRVPTGKSHRPSNTAVVFDVNTKAAMGMLNAGLTQAK